MAWKIGKDFLRKMVFEIGLHSWVVTMMCGPYKHKKRE
jgi:hypothetical protein